MRVDAVFRLASDTIGHPRIGAFGLGVERARYAEV